MKLATTIVLALSALTSVSSNACDSSCKQALSIFGGVLSNAQRQADSQKEQDARAAQTASMDEYRAKQKAEQEAQYKQREEERRVREEAQAKERAARYEEERRAKAQADENRKRQREAQALEDARAAQARKASYAAEKNTCRGYVVRSTGKLPSELQPWHDPAIDMPKGVHITSGVIRFIHSDQNLVELSPVPNLFFGERIQFRTFGRITSSTYGDRSRLSIGSIVTLAGTLSTVNTTAGSKTLINVACVVERD